MEKKSIAEVQEAKEKEEECVKNENNYENGKLRGINKTWKKFQNIANAIKTKRINQTNTAK